MLHEWRRLCKTMVLLILNSDCLIYRVWKDGLEKKDEWKYGKEIPQHSLYKYFY